MNLVCSSPLTALPLGLPVAYALVAHAVWRFRIPGCRYDNSGPLATRARGRLKQARRLHQQLPKAVG